MTDVLIHLGQHKTGSKALQAYLFHNRDQLIKHKIFYPKSSHQADVAYQKSHFCLYVISKYEALKALGRDHEANILWLRYGRVCSEKTVYAYFFNIEKERQRLAADQVIFSAEDLFDMATAHELAYDPEVCYQAASIICSACSLVGWKPKLVVYIRRPDELVQAQYAQYIKGSDSHVLDFERYFKAFYPRLNLIALLKPWETFFDFASIIVRAYDGKTRRSIVNDFNKVAKFESLKGLKSNPKDLESENRTPSRVFIDLIREMNEKRMKGEGFIPRTIILQYAYDHHSRGVRGWLNQREIDSITSNFFDDFKNVAKSYAINGFFDKAWQQQANLESIDTLTIDEIKFFWKHSS